MVYLLPRDARLLVTDVDGTITSTDVGGRIYPTFGIKANHDSVVKLIDGAVRNGLHAIYLTGRSMGEDEGLREYLFEVMSSMHHPTNLTLLRHPRPTNMVLS